MITAVSFEMFITSPGAGGAGALLAALIIGIVTVIVSIQRRTEANREREDAARALRIEQWWTRYIWLISVDKVIPIEGRLQILGQLKRDALIIKAPELGVYADKYGDVIIGEMVERVTAREGGNA